MRRFVLLILILSPMGDISGQTFGLGEDDPVEVSSVAGSDETFGLGDYHAASAALVKASRATNAARSAEKLDSKPSDTNAVRVIVPEVSFLTTKAVTRAAPYSSPPGYHRHVMVDGGILLHRDENFGDAAAHAGVAGRGWPKYTGPKPPTMIDESIPMTARTAGTCPPGGCPPARTMRRGIFRR